jgi:hypothetical protein
MSDSTSDQGVAEKRVHFVSPTANTATAVTPETNRITAKAPSRSPWLISPVKELHRKWNKASKKEKKVSLIMRNLWKR